MLFKMPNLEDYDAFCRTFDWQNERRQLSGLPGGQGLNIAHEAVDRHAAGPLKDTIALRWIRKDKSVLDLTYAGLQKRSARFANVLGRLGVAKGDTVFSFAGRIPELYVTAFGTLKKTAVFSEKVISLSLVSKQTPVITSCLWPLKVSSIAMASSRSFGFS